MNFGTNSSGPAKALYQTENHEAYAIIDKLKEEGKFDEPK
jgi:hypothetical protein